jgi:hypothetical protein
MNYLEHIQERMDKLKGWIREHDYIPQTKNWVKSWKDEWKIWASLKRQLQKRKRSNKNGN